MNPFASLGGSGVGLFPSNIDREFYNRSGTALVKGALVQLDIHASPQAESTSKSPGGMGSSIWSNVVNPTTAGLKSGIFAVALEAVADNASGKFRLCGIVDALQFEVTGAIAIGDDLYAVNASPILGTVATASARVLGIAMAVVADADPAVLASCWFYGLPGGLGVHYAS